MKFLADDTLGALVRRLRFLGFDAEIAPFAQIPDKLARDPERIFLSRSQKRVLSAGGRGFWVRPDKWQEQLQQIFGELPLSLPPGGLTRCSCCNLILEEVKDKAQIEGQVPDYIYSNYDEYYGCRGCGRLYWPGSHWQKLENFIAEFKKTKKTEK